MTLCFVFGLSLTGKALVFQGLTNSPLGAASVMIVSNLTSGGQDGEVISNLSSSGQDGVAITLPANLTGLDVQWQDLDSSGTLPVGAFVQSQAVGTANGINNGVLGTLTVTKTGAGNYAISANYLPLGAAAFTVQIYYQGALVAQTTSQSGATFASVNMMPRGKNLGDIITPLSEEWPDGEGVMLTMVGTKTRVPCDQLIVTPNNLTITVVPAAFQIVASQVPAITITSENVSMEYQGLINTSLGAATLDVTNLGSSGQDGEVVSNLTSGGQDGVSITLPANLAGLDVSWQQLDASNTLPVGAYLQTGIVGTGGLVTNGVLGTATVTKAGTGDYLMSANFSPIGASTCVVQAFLNGVLVAQVTNQNPASLAGCPIWPISDDIERYETSTGWVENRTWSWDWSFSTAVTLSGGPTVNCDHLFIIPQNVSFQSPPTAFQIVASQVPAFTITGENAGLVYQGLINTSVRQAAFYEPDTSSGTPSTSALIVSNLNSGGQDGVSITLPAGLATLAVNWLNLDPSNSLPVGAYVEEQLIGTDGGITNGVLGSEYCTKNGTGDYAIGVDYAPLGSSAFVAQVYNGSTLVSQTTGSSGAGTAVATAALPPGTCTINPWLNMEWPAPTAITLNGGAAGGGTAVMGTEILVIPVGAAAISSVSADQILAANIPALTITSENVGLVFQGLTNTSLGQAAFYEPDTSLGTPSTSTLIVSNLTSGGQDGVSIGLPANLTGLDVQYQDLDPSNSLPVGAYLQSQIVGTVTGLTNGVLGTVTVTKECAVCGGSNYLMSADFSSVWAPATTMTTLAYLNGVLVGQAMNQTGPALASLDFFPDSIGIGTPPQDAQKIVTIGPVYLDWSKASAVSFAGVNVTCDHLVIVPEGVTTAPVVTAYQLTASQVPGFTITSENASLMYQGLINTSVGQAAFYEPDTSLGTPSTSTLIVSNLTSGGQDGVSIGLPANLAGLDVNWQNLDPSNSLPVGAYIQDQVVGTLPNGTSDQVLATSSVTEAGTGNYVLTADFSPIGASSEIIQAYLDGVLVAQSTNQNGSALGSAAAWPCPDFEFRDGDWFLTWHTTSGPTSVSFGTGSGVACDHLVIIPQNAASGSVPAALQIIASQIPAITITGENISSQYQGLIFTSLGQAAFYEPDTSSGTPSTSTLVISNLTSGGQDGVSITLPVNLTGWEVEWQPLDPSNSLPVGAYIQSQVIGTANAITNGVLGSATVTKECAVCGGSNFLVSADFSPLGAKACKVQAYYQGALVAQETNQPGAPLAGCSSWPSDINIIYNVDLKTGQGQFTISFSYDNSATTLSLGGSNVTCDQLEITPEGVSLPSAPSALQITASQVPSITMTAVTVSPWLVNLSQTGQNIMLQWYGTGTLQESSNLVTWTGLTNASSPYAVTPSPTHPAKFYRLIFAP